MNFNWQFDVPKYYNFFDDHEKKQTYQMSQTDRNDCWFMRPHPEMYPQSESPKQKDKLEEEKDDEDLYFKPIKRKERLPPMFQGLAHPASAHSIMKRLNSPTSSEERNIGKKKSRLKSGESFKNFFASRQSQQFKQKISPNLVTHQKHQQNLQEFKRQGNKDYKIQNNSLQKENNKNGVNTHLMVESKVKRLQQENNQQRIQNEIRQQRRTEMNNQSAKNKNFQKNNSLKQSKSQQKRVFSISRRLFIANDRKPCPYPPRMQRQWELRHKKEWYSLSPKSKETAQLSMGKNNLKRSRPKQNSSSLSFKF